MIHIAGTGFKFHDSSSLHSYLEGYLTPELIGDKMNCNQAAIQDKMINNNTLSMKRPQGNHSSIKALTTKQKL